MHMFKKLYKANGYVHSNASDVVLSRISNDQAFSELYNSEWDEIWPVTPKAMPESKVSLCTQNEVRAGIAIP